MRKIGDRPDVENDVVLLGEREAVALFDENLHPRKRAIIKGRYMKGLRLKRIERPSIEGGHLGWTPPDPVGVVQDEVERLEKKVAALRKGAMRSTGKVRGGSRG